MCIPSKVIYRLSGLPIKIPMSFVSEIGKKKKNPDTHMKSQGTMRSWKDLQKLS